MESFEWTKTLSKIRNLFFFNIFLYVSLCGIILFNPIITWIILPLDGLFILLLLLSGKYLFDLSRISYLGKKRQSNNVLATIQARN
ncbi:MAG: hypothetical protein ACFE96_19255, partial [Candidatus Hermodarchaeota archaeon]